MTQQTTATFPPAWRRTGSGWLAAKREEAWRAFEAGGWPAKTDEAWRGSELARFVSPALAGSAVLTGPQGARPALPPRLDDTVRIVVRDGVPDELPSVEGVRLAVLGDAGDAGDAGDEVARVHFGRAAQAAGAAGRDAFTLINTAQFAGGLLVDVRPDAAPETLEIVHACTGTVSFPRVLVHVQRGATATVIERFVGVGATYAVTELDAHDGAQLRHTTIAEKDPTAMHLHSVFGHEGRDVMVHQANLAWGGASVRSNVSLHLAGPGAQTEAVGLALARGKQRIDDWTRIDHAVPDTQSRQDYRCILDGKARTRFTGNVLVRHGAQRTAAEQENRNLVLSRGALAESTPQLEIHADDVKCSHGSTVGRLDDDALFFLRTRGIPRADAVTLLTKAFASKVTKTLAPASLRALAEARLDAWFEEADA